MLRMILGLRKVRESSSGWRVHMVCLVLAVVDPLSLVRVGEAYVGFRLDWIVCLCTARYSFRMVLVRDVL